MNGFIHDNKVNFFARKQIDALNEINIVTVDNYVEFVHMWRQVHKQIVDAIHHFRQLKNQAKVAGDTNAVNTAWRHKKIVGNFAREMYKIRIERKDALKQGKYLQLEAAE